MKKSVAILENKIRIKLNIELRKNARYLSLSNIAGKIVNQFHSNAIMKIHLKQSYANLKKNHT